MASRRNTGGVDRPLPPPAAAAVAALAARPVDPARPPAAPFESLVGGQVLFQFDPELRLRWYSAGAGAAFRLLPGELGRAIADLDLGLATREVEVLLRDVLSRGAALDHEVQDRRGHWFMLCAYPLAAGAGAALLVVDIDRLKRAEQSFRDSDRRKDEFIATLAHELRSPLAALRDASELMNDSGARPGDAAQARSVMDRQIANMVRMVDDLAELSRLQHGPLRLRVERVDVSAALSSAVAATEHERRTLSQTLTLELPPIGVEIVADAMRLEQIFTNLLGNACKATPRRAQIAVSLEPADTDGTPEIKVRLRQKDSGFFAQSLPRVLDVLSAAPAPPTSRAAMSLSLYLARTLAELHGGALEVHGGGAEFVVRLPLQPARAAGPAREPAGDSRRVLVVDDNVDAARIMAMVLGVSGHEVRLVHQGSGTVEAARAFQPDAVLLDIGLPDIDGYEVARQLRAEPGMEHILLVAVTGYGRDQDIRMSRAAGFDEHFTKPVNPDALNALLLRQPERAATNGG